MIEARNVYPLSEPAITPRIMKRCMSRKNITIGAIPITNVASIDLSSGSTTAVNTRIVPAPSR